jgi:hypothetical protein
MKQETNNNLHEIRYNTGVKYLEVGNVIMPVFFLYFLWGSENYLKIRPEMLST